MERAQLRPALGIGGAILLFIGVFLPIVQVPFLGSVNYFQNGKGDGVILIVLAVISVFIVAGKEFKYLWITGGASLATLGYTLFNFNSRMSVAHSQMQRDLANNPYADVGSAFLNMVQFQWGWAVLVIGAAALLASAALRPSADEFFDEDDEGKPAMESDSLHRRNQ